MNRGSLDPGRLILPFGLGCLLLAHGLHELRSVDTFDRHALLMTALALSGTCFALSAALGAVRVRKEHRARRRPAP